jgi:uncharacterized protein YbaA (DUF1428 family)
MDNLYIEWDTRACFSATPACGVFEKVQPLQEFAMSSATTNFSPLRLIIAAALTVLFCAGAALAIVGWTPGASGLPADVAAVQESE